MYLHSSLLQGEYMAFAPKFLEGRKRHLINKMRVTKEALNQPNLLLAQQRYKKAVLMQIRNALNRLDAGTYGICPDCFRKISEKRLSLHPQVLRCVPCQEAHDARMGQH